MAVGSRLRHVVESQQFSRALLEELFVRSDEIKREPHHFIGRLAGQVMAALFYEPSTRTRLSFEAAMLRLGGQTMGTDNAREFSSAAKGETLEDTIRIVSGYADVIVLRHSEEGAAKRAAAVSDVPIINAGDGPGQHPTQALLDLFTIRAELAKIDGVRVAMVGDLANGRTVRSLAYLLSKFKDIKLWFVAPPQRSMTIRGPLTSARRATVYTSAWLCWIAFSHEHHGSPIRPIASRWADFPAGGEEAPQSDRDGRRPDPPLAASDRARDRGAQSR